MLSRVASESNDASKVSTARRRGHDALAGVLRHFHVPVTSPKKIKVVDMSSMFVELRNEQVWIMCINTKEAQWQTNIKIYRFPESKTPEI